MTKKQRVKRYLAATYQKDHMHQSLLAHLRCPLTKEPLTLDIISSKEKVMDGLPVQVIDTGILSCASGMIYPVTDGVPHLLLESFLDNEAFLRQHLTDFSLRKKNILQRHGKVIFDARRRNAVTKKSYSLQWRLMESREKVNIWSYDVETYKKLLFSELGVQETDIGDKKVLDVGCGHGRASRLLSNSRLMIGMDMSMSVLHLEKMNDRSNCHYIQADLLHLPFAAGYFDMVYSSGVLQMTVSTKKAFDTVSRVVAGNGRFCVWLYHKYENRVQNWMLNLRKVTRHLPLHLQYWLYLCTLMPVHKMVSWWKGTNRHWREIMVNLMDVLSPQYRHEHTADEAEAWFEQHGFHDVSITTRNDYGFSMVGIRPATA